MKHLYLLGMLFFLTFGLYGQNAISTSPPLTGGTGSNGVTFNLETLGQSVRIDSIRTITYNSWTENVDVWFSPNAINGTPNISTANGWTQAVSTPITVSGGSTSSPVWVTVPVGGLFLQGGINYGFYIGKTGVGIGYQTWNSANQDVFTDGTLTLYNGQNIGYGGPVPTPTNHPRQFVGTIYYSIVNPAPWDAGVTSITPTSVCPGNVPLSADIRNFGSNIINNLTVNWSVNGVAQTPVNYTGAIDTIGGSGNNIVTVNLGSFNFAAGGTYNIEVTTNNPNGNADTVTFNDTLITVLVPSLTGTYTIGGTTPDFPDLSSAAAALSSYGICGPVIFNVREGTYNEQVTFENYTGSSSTNTITFQPDPANTQPAIVTYAPTTAATNYTLQFINNAQYITVNGLTLATGTGSYGTVVMFDDANNITLNGNEIQGQMGAGSTSTNYNVIDNNSGPIANNITITNNNITGGSYGMYWYGATGQNETGNIISGNSITGWHYRGIQIYYQDGIVFSGNTIENNGAYTSPAGINFYNSENGVLSHNKLNISGSSAPDGIYISGVDATTASPSVVFNNFVTVAAGTGAGSGISVTGSDEIAIDHNNVNFSGGSATATAAYITGATTDHVYLRNNSLVSTGLAIYLVSASPIVVSDYNNIYSTGTDLARYTTTLYQTLAAYQAGASQDANSVSVNPGYTSATDLHVTNFVLDGAATPLAYVTDDIDGQPRTATPDIGADEFFVLTVDAGVLQIDTPGVSTCTIGPVWVTVRNYGLVNLTQATINWGVNSTPETPVTFTLNVAPNADTMLYVGTTTFVSGDVVYAYTTNPNGTPENPAGSANDSAVRTVNPGMAGTYTIGGVAPDYADFVSAEAALTSRGLCGSVVFNVREGTYNQQVSFKNYAGVSSVNTITFQPDPGNTQAAILTYTPTSTGDNFTVQFDNNAQYISINGLTLTTGGGTYGTVLLFDNTENITIDGNEINGVLAAGSTSTNYNVIDNNTGSIANNVTLSNNHITGGSYSIYWYGGGTSLDETGNVISNNHVDGYHYYGIHFYYQQGLVVTGNVIENNGAYTSTRGISAFNSHEVVISHNHIMVTGSSAPDGMYLSGIDGTTANPNKVFNNFITVTAGTGAANGIYTTGSSETAIDFNSVNIMGGSTTASAVYLTGATGDVIYHRNNNLKSDQLALYIVSANPTIQSDYNNLYSTGTNVARYLTTPYTTLAAFQAAASQDANSISVAPGFSSTTDLHVYNFFLDGAGTPLAYVTDDFDGQTRSATPDIGADEFALLASDAGILQIDTPAATTCTAGPVWVTIRNYGTSNLTQVTVNWGVNSTPETPVSFNLNLATFADTMVFLGTTTFNNGDIVYASTSNPNGSPENPMGSANDTAVQVVNMGLNGTFNIGGPGADYYSYSAAVNDLITRGICGPVTFLVNDSTYTEQITLVAINGASAVNTITFKSASGDSTQSILTTNATTTASNYLIRFAGADHFIFEGLTLENTGTSYGRVVELQTASGNNTFRNNILRNTSTSTGINTAVVYSGSSGSSRNVAFLGNHIEGGYYGFYWFGNSAADRGKHHRIENNTLYNQNYYGVYLSYQDSISIKGNRFLSGTNTGTTSYGVRGAYISNFDISSNHIVDTLNGSGYGIYLIDSEGTPSNKSTIRNNMIAKGSAATTGTTYGIYLSSSGNIEVAHNSTSITSSSATTTSMYVSGGGSNVIVNNSFKLNNTGYGVYYNTSYAIEQSNYNNIYVATGGYIVVADGWGYPTLAIWQGNTGYDLNSKNVNVTYNSASDLHTCAPALSNAGTPGYAMVDIDGEPRSSKPDIGADEFIGTSFSLGADTSYCAGNTLQIGLPSYYGNSFLWSTGDTTNMITVSAPGNYVLDVTGACGAATDNINVVENTAPSPSFTYVNSYLTVTFTNTTSNGTSYLWDFGDGNTSTAVNPMHLFANSGTHFVTLHATNECGTDSNTIVIDVQVTDINEVNLTELVTVYPNPSNGDFRIRMSGSEPGQYNIRLFNLQGQLVLNETMNGGTSNEKSIAASGLASGVYSLTIDGPSGIAVKKIVIR